MIRTKDEILYAFATDILDINPDPDRFPQTTKELIEEQEKEIDPSRFPQTIRELEEQEIEQEQVLKPVVPISIRQEPLVTEEPKKQIFDEPATEHPWLAQDAGSPQWAASNYPFVYLRGDKPFTGYLRDPANKEITHALMDKVIATQPEKYFEWGLRRRTELAEWREPATKALIERDPQRALMMGLSHSGSQINNFLPFLWEKMIETEFKQAGELETPVMFPGLVHKRMSALMKRIKEYQPDYYANKIDGTRFEILFSGRPRRLRKPVSTREELPRGSLPWLAEHYPQVYLKGRDDVASPSGFVRDARHPDATKIAMEKLIATNPIKYFEWGLRRPSDLKQYIYPAAKSLIQQNPHEALMFKIYKQGPEIQRLLPDLWENLIRAEHGRKQHDKDAKLFPGRIFNNMKSLAGEISRTHPEFYMKKIARTPFATEEFNGWARDALVAKQQ